MKIQQVNAIPTTYEIAPENGVTLGIGIAVKWDAVVKVVTESGFVGGGEANHGWWAGLRQRSRARLTLRFVGPGIAISP